MFNRVVVYTKNNCEWCTKLKDWLSSLDIQYIELVVGKDITKEELQAKGAPGEITTVPQLFISGKRFGGYTECLESEDIILRYRDSVS